MSDIVSEHKNMIINTEAKIIPLVEPPSSSAAIKIILPDSTYLTLSDFLTFKGVDNIMHIIIQNESDGVIQVSAITKPGSDNHVWRMKKKFKNNDGSVTDIIKGDSELIEELYSEISQLRSQLSSSEQSEDKEKKSGKEKKSRYWSTEEHDKFLEGLKLYGRKDVKSIAAHVGTRNATQVRTHAQKWFLKLNRDNERKSEQKEREKMALEEHIHKEWVKMQSNLSQTNLVAMTDNPFDVNLGYNSTKPEQRAYTPFTIPTPKQNNNQNEPYKPYPFQTSSYSPSFYHQDEEANIIYNQISDSNSLHTLADTLQEDIYPQIPQIFPSAPVKRKANRTLSDVVGVEVSISPDILPQYIPYPKGDY